MLIHCLPMRRARAPEGCWGDLAGVVGRRRRPSPGLEGGQGSERRRTCRRCRLVMREATGDGLTRWRAGYSRRAAVRLVVSGWFELHKVRAGEVRVREL